MQTVEERSEESFVHSAPTPLYVLGIAVDVYLDGEATDGQYASYRVTLPARSGPPPHRHEGFDEAFVVLSGTVEFMLEGRTQTLGAGDSVFMPRGAIHAFRNVGGEDAVLMGTATPSGHEHFFRDAGWKEEAGTPEAIRTIFARHGIEIVL